MPTFANRLALAALLMGCTALSSTAQAGWFSSDDAKPAPDKKSVVKSEEVKPAPTLDGSIRQAQLLRLAGQYPDAIKHLSQLMMVASDDYRVVSEYGKTLVAMGRAQEALNFLGRAQQLQPTDWTIYSATGVALDQLGKQTEAQVAYEHALSLKPNEASVLNNYALSRMLAKDPDGAKSLIARAQAAGGAEDAKIARNIAMIKDLAPETAVAANSPAPETHHVAAAPQAAPRTPVTQAAIPQAVAAHQSAPFVTLPQPAETAKTAPTGAPRPLVASNTPIPAATSLAQPATGVVMQRVPVDPLAGPVMPKVAAKVAPKVAAAHMAPAPKTEAAKSEPPKADAKTEMPKPEKQVATAKPAPAKTAATEALELQAKADAIAKQLAAKPGAKAAVMAAASKPDATDTRTGPSAKLVLKAPEGKPQAKPETRQPVKVADAKPAPAKPEPAKPETAKPAAKSAANKAPKDTIPGLRLSANTY